jgi:PAS domain S-box-containing protein
MSILSRWLGIWVDESLPPSVELTEGEEYGRASVKPIADGIIMIDADSRIILANPGVQQIFGYGPELVGQSLTVLMPRSEWQRHQASLTEYTQSGVRHVAWEGVELTGLHKSGRKIPVEISFAESEIGDQRFFVGHIRDIAAHKRAEQALRDSERQYRELYVSAQRQAQDLALRDRVRTAIARELDLPALFRTVTESIAETYGYAQVSLYLLEGDTLILQHQVGSKRGIPQIPITSGICGRVVRTGQPVLIEDIRTAADFLGVIEDTTSEITVPLRDEGRVVGTLCIETTQGVILTESDFRLMTALAEHVSVAIARARLYDDLQRQNQTLSALQDSTMVLMARHDLVDMLQEILAQAARLMKTSHGYIYLARPSGDALEVQVATGVFSGYDGARLRPGEGLAGKVWQSGQPLVVSDYHTWAERSRQYDQTDFHAVVGVPLTEGSKTVGVLGLGYVEPGREFSDEDARLLTNFARLASIAYESAHLYTQGMGQMVERQRVDAALKESEERYRIVSELASDYSYADRVEPDGSIVAEWVTEVFTRVTGYSLEDRQAPGFWQRVIHPDDLPLFEQHDARLLAGQPDTIEGRIITRSGKVRWVRDSVRPIWDPVQGRVVRLYGGAQDITERKQAEALQAAVFQISEAAHRATSLDELFQSVHAIIGTVMPARNFYIALYHPENDLISFPYYQDEVDGSGPTPPVPARRGMTEYVLRTGRPVLCGMARFEELIMNDEVELVGPPSPVWLGVPLTVENKSIGVMAMQDYTDPDAYGQRELQMLEFVSHQVAKEIERTRLASEIQQSNRILSALEEATLPLMRELGLDEVLNTILALTAQLMNTPHGYLFLVEPDESALTMRLGLGMNTRYIGTRLGPDEGLAGKVWVTGQPLVIQDYHHWTGRSTQFEGSIYHATAGVPLTAGSRVIGVLGVGFDGAGFTISAPDVDLLKRFAQLASLALENARLYQSAQDELAERKQAEEALAESEERFRALIEHGADQVSLVAPDGSLLYENPSSSPPLGYERGAFQGLNLLQLLHPDDLERAQQEWAEVLSTPGISHASSFRLQHADGTFRWMEGTATNLVDEPSVGAIVINYRDITGRKKVEEEISRLNAELEQRVRTRTAELEAANKELEAFSYSVSHDLRAPLRTIDGYASLLGSEFGPVLPAEAREYLSRVRQGSQRMNRLIMDLLALSRVTRQVLDRRMVNLSNIAQAVANDLQEAAPDRQVEVVIGRGLAAEGDPGLLQIVLQNLLGNAWKFTSKSGQAHIEFGVLPDPLPPFPGATPAQDGSGKQVFFVRDDGAGFDMAHADKLFGPFQRLHAEADFEGTGIGLATVERIIHRHGGEVWAEGEVGRGATFYFTL